MRTNDGTLLDTLKVVGPYPDEADSVDLPYAIRPGFYYHPRGGEHSRPVKPTLLWLQDYNGDGRALEFVLYERPACMGLPTTLIGYNPDADRMVQYHARLAATFRGSRSVEDQVWVDYLFYERPVRPGVWRYEIDYRGRNGSLDRYRIHYNRSTRRFEGTVSSICDDCPSAGAN